MFKIKQIILILTLIICFISCNQELSFKQKSINKNWFFKSLKDTSWINANVPGNIHLDLLENGIIEDPYYRLNEHDLQWIDKNDWLYKTSFSISQLEFDKKNSCLEFSGLDTYAKVYVNDSLLLISDNMFRSYIVDVKDFLKLGSNDLQILFESPINKGIEKREKLGYYPTISANDLSEIGKVQGNQKVSVYSRKAGYHFGWDWGPRLVTSGIWKPITYQTWNNFKINDMYIQQDLQKDNVVLNTSAEISFDKDYIGNELFIEAVVSKDNHDISRNKIKIIADKNINTYNIPVEIMNPKLWWPNGMGEQYLYDLNISIFDEHSIDSKSLKTGIRTIELVREPDSIGTSFYFKVNGHPVFMKGANYIPQDAFLARPTNQHYKHILTSAKKANMNMIRVWGGGVYESNYFYELCDEMGLLVWQDFMFACAMYPGNKHFLNNVKQEAIDNIKRIRNHTSLALWCGNNEVLTAWENWGWKELEAKNQSKEIADTIFKAYDDIFHKILPETVSEMDPATSYWPSSPGSDFGKIQKMESGNAHFWWVWWGKKSFDSYNDSIPRFMAEFGFQSFPELNSVAKYTLPNDYDMYSDVMKSHQRSSIGNETIEEYMVRDYNKPNDFEQLLYVSQLLQAYGIKIGIEAHRRNRHRCMGSLYWQLNDCWPVASWSGIDYYGKWKALHYTVKDAFKNYLISCEEKNDSLNIYIVSDSLKSLDSKLIIRLIDFKGNELFKWNKNLLVEANSSKSIFKISKNAILNISDLDDCLLTFELFDLKDNIIADNIKYLLPFKDLDLPAPNLDYSISESDNSFIIKLKTDVLAKNIFLISDSKENFTNNFFDLLPNESIEIEIKKETGQDLPSFNKSFKIMTLDQTY